MAVARGWAHCRVSCGTLATAAACGPFRVFPAGRLLVGGESRQDAPGRGSCWSGRRFAPTSLWCSIRGRVAKLTPFAVLTAFRHCDESVFDTRCARRPRICAPRRPRNRPRRVPPAARHTPWSLGRRQPPLPHGTLTAKQTPNCGNGPQTDSHYRPRNRHIRSERRGRQAETQSQPRRALAG